MTGTERAALRLALGVLRASVSAPGNPDSTAVLALSRAWSLPTEAASWPCWLAWDARSRSPFPSYRILRARLALYLRTVLRAEAGDRGLWWVGQRKAWPYFFPVEWRSERVPPAATRKTAHGWKAQPGDTYRLAVPLWSQAPGRET